MAKKKSKIEILSYTYKKDGEIHTATTRNIDLKNQNPNAGTRGPSDIEPSGICNCGETKCVNGKKWKCMPLDDEGNCIWFITSESC